MAERALSRGKVQNLRVAARHIDGALVPAGTVFSFWKQVGRATRRRGFVEGRELREGCLVPSVGGGLCQLSNALYDAALRAGFDIVERHAHTAVVPGSPAAVGRDATVFWNYVDLRFRAPADVRIECTLTRDSLVVRYWGSAPAKPVSAVMTAVSAVVPVSPAPVAGSLGDCASCGIEHCFRHAAVDRHDVGLERTAFLLDTYWPEFDAFVTSVARQRDLVFVPIDGRRRGTRNYRWNTSCVEDVRESLLLTLLRAYRSRRMAYHGAARQRLLLSEARRMAQSFAKRLPYDVRHLVVMQHLLPGLSAGGHLGGRTYDVLMTGMPLRALQRSLDRAHALHPESATLGDFRAEPALVDAEERALAGARTIVTPHAAVAAAFGSRAVRVPWIASPESDSNGRAVKHAREAILFPASTLGRAGAYEVRDVARSLGVRVILAGPVLEDARFWDGVSTEVCSTFAAALAAGPRAVVLPAFVENQPRRLLHAASAGIPVIASDACGLDSGGAIEIVPAGDGAALRAAVEARFARSAR
jgi:hypothetical protein